MSVLLAASALAGCGKVIETSSTPAPDPSAVGVSGKGTSEEGSRSQAARPGTGTAGGLGGSGGVGMTGNFPSQGGTSMGAGAAPEGSTNRTPGNATGTR